MPPSRAVCVNAPPNSYLGTQNASHIHKTILSNKKCDQRPGREDKGWIMRIKLVANFVTGGENEVKLSFMDGSNDQF